jgi:hypothetical protein
LIKQDIKKCFGLNYSENCGDVDIFHKNMVDWIYDSMSYLADKKNSEYFKKHYVNFESKVEEGTNSDGTTAVLTYHIDDSYMMAIEKGEHKKDSWRWVIDKELKNYMENLSNNRCYTEYIKNKTLLVELAKLREEMIAKLKQEENVPIYLGKCKFL